MSDGTRTDPRRARLRRVGRELLLGCSAALVVGLVLGALDFWSADGVTRSPGSVLLYLAQLVVPLTALLAPLLALGRAMDAPAPVRWASLAAVLLVLLAAPHLVFLATALSEGDGVRAAGLVTVVHHAVLAFSAVGVLGLFVWMQLDRWTGRLEGLWWLFGLGALAGLLFIDARLLRTLAFLAPMASGATLLVSALLVFRLARDRRAAARALGVFAVAALALYGGGRFDAGLAQSGRLAVLRVDGIAQHLDALAFGDYPVKDMVRLDLEGGARLGCDPRPEDVPARPAGPARVRNVVLVSVDALRADALAWTHEGRLLMPATRRFAETSVHATRASTTYPATIFALGGAVTGLSPSRLLFSPTPPRSLLRRVEGAVDRVRVLFPDSGWFAQPAIDSLVLQGTPAERFGDAAPMTDAALAALASARSEGESLFLWVHYLDLHQPIRNRPDLDFGRRPPDLYRENLVHLDRQLARLFEALDAGGWYEDTLVIFFADHGEALGEHRYVGHHVFLNGWIMDVPLIYRMPGEAPRVRADLVGTLDVAPTVLDALGLARPPLLEGRSLLEPPPPDRAIVGEAFPLRGEALFELANDPVTSVAELAERMERVRTESPRYEPRVSLRRGDHRLIVRRNSGATELYDLRHDPGEQHDLSTEAPALLEDLVDALGRWHLLRSRDVFCETASLGGGAEGAPPP